MKTAFKLQSLVIALVIIVACGGGDPEPTPTPSPQPTATAEPTAEPTAAPEPTEEPAAQPDSPLAVESPLAAPASPLAEPDPADSATFSDPFAYCAAIQNIDAPDSRYTGPDAPEGIALGLRLAFETPDTPLSYYQESMFWRCMDGMVYACTVGANLPCSEKADPDTEPSEAILAYCEETPDSDFVPMVATGRATIYQWSCEDGLPQAGDAISAVDEQGFLADIWYAIDADAVAEAEQEAATEEDSSDEDDTEDDTEEE